MNGNYKYNPEDFRGMLGLTDDLCAFGEETREDGSKTIYERWMSWNVPPPSQALAPDQTKAGLKSHIEYLESLLGGKYPPKEDLPANQSSLDTSAGDMVYISISASAALPSYKIGIACHGKKCLAGIVLHN
jgi:hypothetical protein